MKKDTNTSETEIQVKKIKLSQSFLHFSVLHQVSKFKYQVILTILMALLFSFFGVILVQNTGLYGMGVEGLGQSIARLGAFLISKYKNPRLGKIMYNILFWLFVLIMNIPLLIFSYFKISKRFFRLTTIFMVFSTIFGIAISSIPGMEKIFIFGSLLPKDKGNSTILWDELENFNIQIVFWNYERDAIKQLSLFLYAISWAIVQAILASALFIIHSSSGGFDIVGIAYSRKFFKSVGTIFTIVHLVSLILANLLGTYIPASLISNDVLSTAHTNKWSPSIFLNPNFVAGISMIIVNGLIVNILFPKYNLVRVEIYSQKVDYINEMLKTTNKIYTTSISKVVGGYSLKEQKILNTTCLFFDAASLLRFVRKIDENAFFTLTDVKKADGYIYVAMNVDKKKKKIKLLEENEKNNLN